MDHKQIISTIIAIFATMVKEQKPLESSKDLENGHQFVWKLEDGVLLTVDQFDEPANTNFHINGHDFELILEEDSENKRYKLDAPKIGDEEVLGAWLGKMWMKCHKNIEQFQE